MPMVKSRNRFSVAHFLKGPRPTLFTPRSGLFLFGAYSCAVRLTRERTGLWPLSGVCRTSSIRLPCVYDFFLAVVVIRYETTATARWALLFIVRAFFNDTITIAVWTGFHVRLMGMLSHTHDYIRGCFADAELAAAFRMQFGSLVD